MVRGRGFRAVHLGVTVAPSDVMHTGSFDVILFALTGRDD